VFYQCPILISILALTPSNVMSLSSATFGVLYCFYRYLSVPKQTKPVFDMRVIIEYSCFVLYEFGCVDGKRNPGGGCGT